MNAEIIKDFLAGLGFQPEAGERLAAIGTQVTRNIIQLGRVADATVLSMGHFIGRLADGLNSFSTSPRGGAANGGINAAATEPASSQTGLARFTGTLAGMNRTLQAPSMQAATALAPMLSWVQGTSGSADATGRTGLGGWEAYINNAGASLFNFFDLAGLTSPATAAGSAVADRQKISGNRPLAGFPRYKVLTGNRNQTVNTGKDTDRISNGSGAVRDNATDVAGKAAFDGAGAAMVRNSAFDVARHIASAGNEPAAVTGRTPAADSAQAAPGSSAVRNSIRYTLKEWGKSIGRRVSGGHGARKTTGGAARPAGGAKAVRHDALNADVSPLPSVMAKDTGQNSAVNRHGTPVQTGNQTDTVPPAGANGQGGIASLPTLLNGAGAPARRFTGLARAGWNRGGNAAASLSGDSGQAALNSAGTGGALADLAKRFNVNPAALLNIAGPRLSASLAKGTGQWEQGRSPYANELPAQTGAAPGAATLNQTTNITVNGAVAPSETANQIADRQTSVNATLTQLLSPKAR